MFSERTNWKLTPNRLTQALEEARASGARILDLTVSNPTRIGLEYDWQAILGALGSAMPTPAAKSAARMGHLSSPRTMPGTMDYDPQAKGLREAREAVAGYYRDEHGICDVDAERMVLTTSTSEGYSFVFRLLCNAGDELLVPKPSYPLFEFLADLQDVRLVAYPLIYDHGWQMDFPSLERAATERTRGVVVVHPNNPTGSYVSEAERRQLNEFCRERGLAVIVDEVFLDYGVTNPRGLKPASFEAVNGRSEAVPFAETAHEGGSAVELRSTGQPGAAVPTCSVQHSSFAANPEVLTFTLSGLSKIAALPQMKVAWVVTSGPSGQVSEAIARLEVIADTYLSTNAPVQWAVPVMLEQRRSIQKQLLERVENNLGELDRQLAGRKACQRLEAEGGWYAVLRVPVTRSDEELAIELVREKRVLVHPGHFYDFASDGYLVVSLIGEPGEFGEGVGRLLQCVNR
jgi:alanine-synthesizing transaminase